MLEFTGERYVPDATNIPKASVNRIRQEHIVRYALAGMMVAGRDVLDFASGEGYGVAMLAGAGARLAHGMDLSAEAVAHAVATYRTNGVEYFVGDVRTTTLNRSYDVVTCFELIEHVAEQAAVIRNAKAHLRPGGFLIISTPRPSDVYDNQFHVKEIPSHELLQLVKGEFAFARTFCQSNFVVSLAGENRLSFSPDIQFMEIAGNVTFDTADFAIVVASDDAEALAALRFRPVATLNDESYLMSVERNIQDLARQVAALRAAEAGLKADVESLRSAEAKLKGDVAEQARMLAAHERLTFEGVRHLEASARAFKEIAERHQRVNACLRSELDAQQVVGETLDLRPKWLRFLRPAGPGEAHAKKILRAISRDSERFSRLTFLNGCPEGESKRYRIENIAEAAKRCGLRVSVIEMADCLQRFRNTKTQLLVIFRTRYNAEVGQLIDDAKARQIPVIFDVDDLVFEPESVDFISAVHGLTEEQKDFHRREVAAFRQTLERCDFATASTAFLAGRLEALDVPTWVVPNTINREQLLVAQLEAAPAIEASAGVRIGYFAGSPTHNKDFLEAAGALLRVLRDFPKVTLEIVGSVELDERFRGFEERIHRHPFMPYLDMLRFMRMMDLVVAPLELNNPFTAGKSELKIFEAALVRVPCVASAVDSYRACVESGKDGFLCAGESEWYDALSTLVRDGARRASIAATAYQRFVPRFYIGNRIADILGIYYGCLRRYRQRIGGTAPG